MTLCYTRHELAPGVHADIPHEHEGEKEPTMCDAEERNRRALYVLENEWGCGRVDIGAMQRLLRGDGPAECDCETTND